MAMVVVLTHHIALCTALRLQMPRGNLEAVSPRPLLLVALRSFLDRREYKRAFLLARKHRLNLNLIVDRDPARFDGDVGVFIEALAGVCV
jgi:elongator complex protein 1